MNPELFTIPGTETPISAYGFMIGLALVLGWILAMGSARRDRLPSDQMGTAYVLSVFFGLFGARAAWLAQHAEAYDGPGSLATLQAGGLAVGAGLVVAVLVSAVFCATKGLPLFVWLDDLAPACLLAVACERLGAFLAGTDFGIYAGSDHPLAVQYPPESPAWAFHRTEMADMPLPADGSLPVHPYQLYGMGLALLGMALVWWLRSRRSFSGQLVAVTMVWYGVTRLAAQPFAVEASTPVIGPITALQVSAGSLILTGAIVYRLRAAAGGHEWEGGAWSPGADGDGAKGVDLGEDRAARSKKKKKKKGKK